MNPTHRILLLLLGLVGLLGLACSLGGVAPFATVPPETEAAAVKTAAYETVAANLTASAPLSTLTSLPPTPADTPTGLSGGASSATPTISPEILSTLTPSATPRPEVSPTSTRTTPLTPHPATTPEIVFKDDFEHSESWYTASTDDYTYEYVNGAYRMLNGIVAAIIWSVRNDEYGDVRLEVDAMRLGGPDDGYYGLACRYLDGSNYYAFVVGPNDFYGIGKMEKGVFTFLDKGTAEKDFISGRDEYNQLQADCFGSILTLTVNNKKLTEVRDPAFVSGDVGMVVGNGTVEAGTQAQFDNFTIWSP